MSALYVQNTTLTEGQLLKLAREIAMDIAPLVDILRANDLSNDDWDAIQLNSRFRAYLTSASEEWNSALNTHERVRIKAAAMIEEWLPELHVRMHDRAEALNHKIEAGKLARDLAGFSNRGIGVEGSGERVTISINLGADAQLKFEKELPTITIEGEAQHG
jgi:hypothetical protein